MVINLKHLWHVDPQNINTIYNVIICIKKKEILVLYNVRIIPEIYIQ